MGGISAIFAMERSFDVMLIERMSHALALRGAKTAWWANSQIGLAVADHSHHPLSKSIEHYDLPTGGYRIVADVRLENREEIFSCLRDGEVQLGSQASDSDYLVAAYHRWKDDCVYHLRGDFAFVLFDESRQCLFGARSPMGLRPFVYHWNAHRFLCASEPRQLLEDASVPRNLDEHWIAFWLTEREYHWSGTPYHAIENLLSGHRVVVDASGCRITPFWEPSPRKALYYERQADYTEHFRHLFSLAVGDCLQSPSPPLYDLSGGLDSSSIVAMAATALKREGTFLPLFCFHAYDDTSSTSDSRPYVQAMKERYPHLDVKYLSFREHLHFAGAFDPCPWIDTPCYPTLVLTDFYRQQWTLARMLGAQVHLRGDFGDELLGASLRYLHTYWDEHSYRALVKELCGWKQVCGIAPAALFEEWVLGVGLRRARQMKCQQERRQASWLRPTVWQMWDEQQSQDDVYFRRICPEPFARELFKWMRFHEKYTIQGNSALAGAFLETREPYADIRLIEYLLSVPAFYQVRPASRKFLLREAMQDRLPETIRQRRDKGMAYRLFFAGVVKHQKQLREIVRLLPEILIPYIDPDVLLQTIDRVVLGDQTNASALSSTLALVLWAHRLPWVQGCLPVSSFWKKEEDIQV